MLRLKFFQIVIIVIFILTLNGCQISSDTVSENTYNENKSIINTPIITPIITQYETTIIAPSNTPSTTIVTSIITQSTPIITTKKIATIKPASTKKTSNSTPIPSKPVNTPKVSCDGDVCRIVTE